MKVVLLTFFIWQIRKLRPRGHTSTVKEAVRSTFEPALRSGLVTPHCAAWPSLFETDLTLIAVSVLLFFMFKCTDFARSPILIFFAFSSCKDWWEKVVLKSNILFVVKWLFISILKTKVDDGNCFSPICSVISVNVKTRFAFCEIMAQISLCVFFNHDSDFLFPPRLGLVVSFALVCF